MISAAAIDRLHETNLTFIERLYFFSFFNFPGTFVKNVLKALISHFMTIHISVYVFCWFIKNYVEIFVMGDLGDYKTTKPPTRATSLTTFADNYHLRMLFECIKYPRDMV